MKPGDGVDNITLGHGVLAWMEDREWVEKGRIGHCEKLTKVIGMAFGAEDGEEGQHSY
jgi:hypothetical protein